MTFFYRLKLKDSILLQGLLVANGLEGRVLGSGLVVENHGCKA